MINVIHLEGVLTPTVLAKTWREIERSTGKTVLVFNSMGGELTTGLRFLEYVNTFTTKPITVVAEGEIHSLATLLFLNLRGKKYAIEGTRIGVHLNGDENITNLYAQHININEDFKQEYTIEEITKQGFECKVLTNLTELYIL